MGEKFYQSSYPDKIFNLECFIFEKYFTSVILRDGLPVFWKKKSRAMFPIQAIIMSRFLSFNCNFEVDLLDSYLKLTTFI